MFPPNTVNGQMKVKKNIGVIFFSILAWSVVGLMGIGFIDLKQALAKYAAYFIDANNGEVLYALNQNTRNYPASLTKIMTLYMVFDALANKDIKLNDKIKVSRRAAGQPPSRLNLKPGQTIKVEDAILALVTKSANDVAVAVAEHLGGSEAKFARQMTKKARTLGMQKTNFRNASGLPNRAQLSTAKDMAVLGVAIQEHFPQYYHYFSNKSFKFNGRNYKNHNNLLGNYKGVDGIKTGYIRASGFQLVASVKRGEDHVIGVVFGGKTAKLRDRHMKKLLNKSFAMLKDGKNLGKIELHHVRNNHRPIRLAKPPLPPEFPDKLARYVRVKGNAKPKNRVATGQDEQTLQTEPSFVLKGGDAVMMLASPASSARLAQGSSLSNPDIMGEWAVQVGAYKNKARAFQATANAKTLLVKKQLPLGVRAIYRPNDRGLYRSMLIGYTKNAAEEACNQLKRNRFDCMIRQIELGAGIDNY